MGAPGVPAVMRVARWAMPLEMVSFMKAIAEVDAAFEQIRDSAMDIAPDEAKTIDERMFAARVDADKGFFHRATLECQNLREKVDQLASSLPERRAMLEARWASLATAITGALTSLNGKLARGKRVPTGMTRKWFDTTRARHAEAQGVWDRARSAAQSGRWAEAVTAGEDARRRCLEVLQELRGF